METLKTILAILVTFIGLIALVLTVFILTDYIEEVWYVIYAFIYFPIIYYVWRKCDDFE